MIYDFLSHRHPDQHLCVVPQLLSVSRREKDANALSEKTSDKQSRVPHRPAVKLPMNAVRLAQRSRISMIQMRLRALPGDPKPLQVASHDRVHIYASFGDKEGLFWFKRVNF